MKLTFILLTAAFLQVSATGTAQTISFKAKNEKLEKVFAEIRKQTGFLFFYSTEDLASAKPVTVELKNVSIEEALTKILVDQPLLYVIKGNTIFIKAKPKETAVFQPADNVAKLPPPIDIHGRILNERGEPVIASVLVKGTSKGTTSNDKGEFELIGVEENATLVISGISIESLEVKVNGRRELALNAKVRTIVGENVNVEVSTGYQRIPKERATGSFELITNEQLDKRVATDILSKLDGISNTLYFDRRNQPANQNSIDKTNIIIRGLSTLTEATKGPLIVVNNFPYEGDINNLNPNDVETITILKDAAAASIWGAKAGNGVIVITTKQGKFNQPFQLSFNSSVQVIQKPDLFKYPTMSSSDFIDVEKNLFDQGFYDGDLLDPWYPGLSPVVETLEQERSGLITSAQSKLKLDSLRKLDVRNQFEKYIYRKAVYQQYFLSMHGGTDKVRYSFSGGLDRNKENLIGNQIQRITFRSDNNFIPCNRVEVQVGFNFSNSNADQNSLGNIGSNNYNYYYDETRKLYPYAQFADKDGNALALAHDWRLGYTDTAGAGSLLNWGFKPLDEIQNADNRIKQNEWIANLAATYHLSTSLNFQASYQLQQTNIVTSNYYSTQTYYTRNLVNLFSQIQNNAVVYQLPNGGILNQFNSNIQSQIGRGQLNLSKAWNNNQISAIGGIEIREQLENDQSQSIYGFNKSTYSSSSVDYVNFYPQYGDRGSAVIPDLNGASKLTDHFVSVYANAAYTYDNRYIISSSFRRDASNLFGVNLNDKWKPFWTVGGAWNLSNEKFYHLKAINNIKLRATYGYQGNVNNTIAPYTVLNYNDASASPLNIPFATITVPANPGLSWEIIKQVNLGLDFNALNSRLKGSIEWYRKTSDNLILNSVTDPTTGISGVARNSAGILVNGFEVQLSTLNINGAFKWRTDIGFNQVKNIVTDYLLDDKVRLVNGIVSGSGRGITVVKGKSPYGVFSYPFLGLDPITGDPLGYNGKTPSTQYRRILLQRLDTANLIYHGSGVPTIYGIINNSFSYKGLSLDIGINYQLNYYFRKSTISYFNLIYNGVSHPDYSKRWQQPGDEKKTTIPSIDYSVADSYRDDFYANSSATVLKGDHIRLQYIRLGYGLNINLIKRLDIKSLEIYSTIENLGIIWRANKEGLDPAYDTGNGAFPAPKKVSFGLKINF